jgi:glycosyltransferase involved in cell wall biosynthesis
VAFKAEMHSTLIEAMGTKLRIHQFLVSREYGGGAEIALQLARHAHRMDASSICVWAPGEGPAAVKVREFNLPMQFYDGQGIYSRSALRAGAANLAVAARLRRSGRGLIHIHSPYTYAALRHGFRLAGVKTVVHIHLDFDVDALRWALKRPPDLIVTCAQSLVDQVRCALPAAYAERQRIVAAPNAVNLERFKPRDKTVAKKCVGAPHNRPLLLIMANLSPHKGQETAIRAVARLRQRGIDVQLWLAGADRSPDKTYEPLLSSMATELGVRDRVTFLGFRNDGPDLLRAADIVLLPSTSEGLPLTLLEAQACHVPVIAAPTAGIPEIIEDGETGFLAPARDSDQYAAIIEALLQQPEMARRIVDQAATRCRAQHSWETYQRRIFEVYRQTLAVKRTGRRTSKGSASATTQVWECVF